MEKSEMRAYGVEIKEIGQGAYLGSSLRAVRAYTAADALTQVEQRIYDKDSRQVGQVGPLKVMMEKFDDQNPIRW